LPCARCLNSACRQPKNYSGAQASSLARGSHTSRRRSSSYSRGQRRPPRTPSPATPLLWREAQQDEEPTDTPTWDVAQAAYSQGAEAMSQGSAGSPVLFLNPAACEDILADRRGEDGRLPSFSDSEPGLPPPLLEVEMTHLDRGTQTPLVPRRDRSTSALPPVPTVDQSTQVISRPHQATSATQTPFATPAHDQSTQVLLRPPRLWAFTQTERPATSTRTSWTQVPRLLSQDAGTEMPAVASSSQAFQAGCYFDNELIPPGAPRHTLPWSYTYAMFEKATLVGVHPGVNRTCLSHY